MYAFLEEKATTFDLRNMGFYPVFSSVNDILAMCAPRPPFLLTIAESLTIGNPEENPDVI